VVTDDELGLAVASRIAELGISTELLHFATGQQGVYLVHSDPNGEREFAYARSGSVGSSLSPDHLPADVISTAGAVVASGISCAISPATRAAVVHAEVRPTLRLRPQLPVPADAQLGRGSDAG
jgi:2-dehydro-3-deoxygluconokinase